MEMFSLKVLYCVALFRSQDLQFSVSCVCLPRQETYIHSPANLLGTFVHLLIHTIVQPVHHVVVVQWIKSCKYRVRISVNVHIKYRNRKKISVALTVVWMLVPDRLFFWVFEKLLISWDFHSKQSLHIILEKKPKSIKWELVMWMGTPFWLEWSGGERSDWFILDAT